MGGFSNENLDELYLKFIEASAIDDKKKEYAKEAIDVIERTLPSIIESEKKSLNYYRLVILYDGIINDAATWMKYSSLKNKALEQSLALNPEALDPRMYMTRHLLFDDPRTGGNPEDGRLWLNALNEDFPDEPDVLILSGDYRLAEGDLAGAKDYYLRELSLRPDSDAAAAKLEEVSILIEGLPIRYIEIINDDDVRTKGIKKTVENFIGKTYGPDTEEDMTEALSIYPGITGISLSISRVEDTGVILSLVLDEKKTKVFGFMTDSFFYSDSNEKSNLGYGVSPVFIYSDMNLGGTGWEFTGAFSGVYLKLQFVYPEHKGLPLDLGFSIDGLAYPKETRFYDNGSSTDWHFESRSASSSLFVEKEIFPGLTVKNNHSFDFFDYSGTKSGFITPLENVKYSGSLSISFYPGGERGLSLLTPHTGFWMKSESAIVYRFNHEDWGVSDDLFTHDGSPGYKAFYLFGYGWDLVEHINFSAQYAFLQGINLYKLDDWSVGQTFHQNVFPRLSGYHGYEFRTSESSLLNLDLAIALPGGRSAIKLNHDVFYFGEEDKLYQGSGAGFVFKFTDSFEMSLYGNYAWNRENEDVSKTNLGLYVKYLKIQ